MSGIDDGDLGTGQKKGLLERLVALPGDAGETLVDSKVHGLQCFLLIEAAFHAWIGRLHRVPLYYEVYQLAICGGLALCAVIGICRRDWMQPCLVAAWCFVLLRHVIVFPATANHLFLEMLLFSLLIFCRSDRRAEQLVLLNGARWLVVIVFFYSGLQKLFYAGYFDGRYLAYLAAEREGFRWVFSWVLSAERLAELEKLAGQHGSGPYAVREPLFVITSNAVYIVEMLIGVMLLIPKWRRITVSAAILMIVAIELAAREFIFGSLAVYLLLLFWPSDLGRRLLPLFVLGFVILVLLDICYPGLMIN